MSGHNSANAGQGAGNFIKEGFTKVHGLGEAIRGNINTFADNVTNTDDTRSRAEVDRGVNEIRTGHYEGAHTAGVTPKDTAQERVQDPLAHGTTTASTTGTGNASTTGTAHTTGTTGAAGSTTTGAADTTRYA